MWMSWSDILTYHPSHDDFGIDIIPDAVHSHVVYGYGFEGYWRDIGTIRAYYETNLLLAAHDSPFNFYDPKLPIYTHEPVLPGSVVQDSILTDVLLAEGCRIEKAQITHSVVGIRSQIGAGTRIDALGAEWPGLLLARTWASAPNCDIEGAILDKNVRLGEGVVIRPFPRGTEQDHDELGRPGWHRGAAEGRATSPPGTRIAPAG